MNAEALASPSTRHPSECPVEDWLAFLGHRWTALVLWHLQNDRRRHSELVAVLPGVSPKVLAERLQGLESRSLVERTALPVFPREVVYALTDEGKRLVQILDQLEIWSREMDEQRSIVFRRSTKAVAPF